MHRQSLVALLQRAQAFIVRNGFPLVEFLDQNRLDGGLLARAELEPFRHDLEFLGRVRDVRLGFGRRGAGRGRTGRSWLSSARRRGFGGAGLGRGRAGRGRLGRSGAVISSESEYREKNKNSQQRSFHKLGDDYE